MADATCNINGCDKKVRSRGWCSAHYERWRKHGSPDVVLPAVAPPIPLKTQPDHCVVEDCDAIPLARSLCSRHYSKWRKYDDPLANVRKRNPCRIIGCDQLAHGYLLCTNHYRRWRLYGDPTWQTPTYTECVILGCTKAPRSTISPLCEMHYYRQRRHGDPLTVREVTGRAMSTNGYVIVHLPGHDLSHGSGWAYEHRVVLHASIGPGEHPCHWCGTSVLWELSYPFDMTALVVDHLDDDKQNNDPSNLVPACNPCNVNRSAAKVG